MLFFIFIYNFLKCILRSFVITTVPLISSRKTHVLDFLFGPYHFFYFLMHSKLIISISSHCSFSHCFWALLTPWMSLLISVPLYSHVFFFLLSFAICRSPSKLSSFFLSWFQFLVFLCCSVYYVFHSIIHVRILALSSVSLYFL